MDDFFFEPADVKPNHSVKKALTSKDDRIFPINVSYQSGEVVLMDHPASLILYKHVTVTVLSGSVTINGYEIKKGESVQVFSSEKTGLVEMKTETCTSIWKKTMSSRRFENDLKALLKWNEICTRILRRCGNSTVVVFIKRCALPSNLEFAEFYCPQAFEFSLFKKNKYKDNLWFVNDEMSPLRFGEEEENLATEIAISIRNAKLVGCEFPKIIVYGPRNTGKSVLLHYLINKALSQFHSAYYLDTDPGQPEFTPPGVVSLTEVEKPILGPPFFHLNKKSTMVFTGDVSPSFVDLYNKSICNLMEVYNNEFSEYPLFVNTMGWVEGTGLQCLINTIDTVKPTFLIEIGRKGETSMFDYREYMPSGSQYYQICCKHDQKSGLSSKMLREMSLLSHLGNCQPQHLSVLPINELRPYCVSWTKIPIFIFPGGNILPSRMVEALNESIVALCCVPETCVLESNIPEFPKTLESDPENQCLAYGLVQAVDERDHLLYIISPLKKDEWAKVNAIIKGNIMMPDSLILQQEIYDVPLPYTDVNENPFSGDEMDVSMVSLRYLFETEAESPDPKSHTCDTKLFPPVENYRKPVARRYNQSSMKKFKR